jgi:hypothetical protein
VLVSLLCTPHLNANTSRRVHAQVENKLAPQPAMVVDTTHLVADAAELAGLSDSSDEDAAAARAPVGQL